MHPSYEMDREYAVRVRGEVTEEMIERLLNGVMLEDGPAKFSDIQQAPGGEGFNHWYHCVVMEGRNREVRRLWESQGLVVSRLKRVRFGPVFLTSEADHGPLPRNGPARDRHPQRGSRPQASGPAGHDHQGAREGRTPAAQAGPSAGAQRASGSRAQACAAAQDGEMPLVARRLRVPRAVRSRAPSARGASRALRLPSGPARATASHTRASRATSVRPARRATSRRPASRRSSGGRNRPATVCVRASAAERKAPWKGPFGAFFMPGNRCLMVARTLGG